MSIFSKSKTVKTTAFGEFIRKASSGEKKRVYTDVLKKATDRQLDVIKRAHTAK